MEKAKHLTWIIIATHIYQWLASCWVIPLKVLLLKKGLGGATPGSIAPYAGMGNMYFDSVEDFGKAFGPNAEKIMGDLPNFTNMEPIVQVSEVM